MNVVRKIFVVMLAGLLAFLLYVLAIDLGVSQTLTQPNKLKTVLSESGIYTKIVPTLLDNAKTSEGDQGGGITLSDAAIKTAAEKTFTPQYIQTNTEAVIDSLYRWLDGSTPLPDFKIDLSAQKAVFADQVAVVAQQKATTLPPCPAALSGSPSDYDVFSASCLPRGLTPAAVGANAKNDILNSKDFLKDAVITQATLKQESDCPQGQACTQKSFFEGSFKDAPKAYQNIKATPIVIGIIALLVALGVILLSSSRRAGLRRVGIILLATGVVILLFTWAMVYIVDQKAIPDAINNANDNKSTVELLTGVVKSLTSDLSQLFYIVGGVYVALGVVAITVPTIMLRRHPRKAAKEVAPVEMPDIDLDEPIEKTPAPTPPPTVPKPKPVVKKPVPKKKTTIKVQ